MATDEAPNEVTAERMPIIWNYCVQVYEAMVGEANFEPLGVGYGDDEGLIYDGFTTKLIRDLGLPVPYYTKILRELQRMDCIRQLRRGGSTTTSRWMLLQEPTRELFKTAVGSKESRKHSGLHRMDTLEQQVRDLNERIHRMEQAIGL